MPRALAMALFLSACSAATEEMMVDGVPRQVRRSVASEYQWAVQSYEAGEYAEAVSRFEKLRKNGTEVPAFELVPYYLGMSHFRLKQIPVAAEELQAFLRGNPQRQEGQDARLALLLCFEQLARWKDSAALAAETDKLTLFQYNRALLKLLWARALREQGELQGAKVVLEGATAYLDPLHHEDGASYASPERNLWGRYYFTALLIKTKECSLYEPREGGKKKLFTSWLEAEVDCLRATLRQEGREIFSADTPWADEAGGALESAVHSFETKVHRYLSETKQLEPRRALQKNAREQIYRLLGSVDEHLKFFKDQGLNTSPLDSLRKQIDRLLVAISNPS